MKNICTIALIASVVAVFYNVFSLFFSDNMNTSLIGIVISFLFAIGFATLELHYDGVKEYTRNDKERDSE